MLENHIPEPPVQAVIDEAKKNLEDNKTLVLAKDEDEEITDEILKMAKDDRKMADKIFDTLYSRVANEKDHSQATKEALTRSLELKIDASRNLIEVLKVKAKKKENNVQNAFVNIVTEKRVGIDYNNLLDHVNKE